MDAKIRKIIGAVSGLAVFGLTPAHGDDLFPKPEWIPNLALGVSEIHDDNILGVSGNGLAPQGTWVTKISPRIGFDFVPLLDTNSPFQSLSFSYAPDFAMFHEAPTENYDAHKFEVQLKGHAGNFFFLEDNDFLYNDGNRVAPTCALNQLSGPQANQFDKYRNQFANTPPRERRNQIQDREASALQYDVESFFVRASTALLDYDMNTAFHNTSKAPYLGYQNYPSRYDVNGGPDFGWRFATNLALTVGYRYGAQYQEQFPSYISSDSHASSSTYQQALVGLEGKPFSWLRVKLDGGPDFRNYERNAPVDNLHPTKYYADATLAAVITTNHVLTFDYKQWNWVSSSGNVPEFDSYYGLNYHWRATSRLAFDLGAKIQNADYTGGNDTAGTAPSIRSDREYTLAPGATYAFTEHLSTTLTYTYNAGNNELDTIPASSHPAYKNFIAQTVFLGFVYRF